MTRSLIFLLLCPALVALNACEKDENKEDEQYAYPSSEMLRFFDFPEGSWWNYRCLSDGTTDSLKVTLSTDGEKQQEKIGGGDFKDRKTEYRLVNQNGHFNISSFLKRSIPFGEVIESEEANHMLFSILTMSLDNSFNYQAPFSYPFQKVNALAGDSVLIYEKLDTTIQGINYPEVYRFPRAWVGSTFSNPIVEEWYVQDVGVVRYTLQNGMEYELVDYHINQ